MSAPVWRLLNTPPARGSRNMAVDEAILLSVAGGASPPTLRFYGWRPPCLSLGCFQPVAEVDLDACAALGIQVVRRPTGGSAILHDNELTYSIAAPDTDPHLRGDILESYHSIAVVLARALAEAGIGAELAPQRPDASPGGGASPVQGTAASSGRPAPCFIRPAGYEILVDGRKLVGSAQMRRAGALLQHGAIPLGGDLAAITELLRLPVQARSNLAAKLRSSAITVGEAAGRTVPPSELQVAIAAAMAAAWQVDLEPGELTPREQLQAERLETEKYATMNWTAGQADVDEPPAAQ